MAKTTTNDVLPMNDKMKTVREALEEAIAIDRRDNGGDPSMYTTQLEAAIAALDSMEAEEGEVVAWIRKWAYDKDEGTRTNRPVGWTLKEVTIAKLLPNDVPLYAHPKAHGEVELTEDEFELQNLMNRCSREHAAKDGADELSRETMAVFVTWLRDHGHLAPFAPPVELTEEEVERTAKDNTDYSKDHPHHFREGFKSCLRHLCSKYHLIPRKP